ncbi:MULTISPECIES: NAD(P)/FAD-dependent oxidoreductase [unclassified Brevundimonas]|uniref:NAD(P)/FAD-dependent oxidoreductase n=1 Tax=unclassified Brevundimonas TaxID=2622653 RepID=UPI0006F58F3E|nr:MULTISPECIES: NAD(P)/FAD-dependent oxidoreductase [unclassified Brevundimonas]KQY79825.1 pyridine nucleotide-disulfide oxidoreductase [Brevundimonas sp. Root1423]KRA28729.1 pyridine nucleotide-disulfide oxidoreductase [Brevundimonas sp. Root608]
MLGRPGRFLADDLAHAVNEAEVLIVGAGPAGLTAATYLARFRRRVLVADGGAPRACWIPLSHNMPGFPSGITGDAILRRMTEQAGEYGAVIEAGRVEHLARDGDGFVARLNGRNLRVRAVLLATGVVDHHPDLPGVERAIERALVRICPICDGYEAIDKAVAVIGDDDKGVREAAFLRTYSDRVTLIHVGPAEALTEHGEMARMGIELIRAPIDNVRLEGDRVTALSWGGTFRSFDLVYSALGTSPNANLAEGLGARVGEDGRLFVDAHQATSVKGLYAAGDVVRGLNQIAVAGAEAAVAATAIHNALREADGWTVRD